MANLFLLSWKAFVMCYWFRAPIKTFFFDACQKTVKSCILYLFPVPQTGRSHIINILLASFFRSVLLIRDPRFFPSIYGPHASRLGHKSMEKNLVRNLQYAPKTRLIRSIDWPSGLTLFWLAYSIERKAQTTIPQYRKQSYFTEYRQPKYGKTAYCKARWYCNTAR